jgi:hypothetical protein
MQQKAGYNIGSTLLISIREKKVTTRSLFRYWIAWITILVLGLTAATPICKATTITYQTGGSNTVDTFSEDTTSTYLVVGYDDILQPTLPDYMAGMRFTNVQIPENAFITDAHLKMQNSLLVWFPGYPVYGIIHAESADDPENFVSVPIGSRPKTNAAVIWDHLDMGGVDWWYTSPDISLIVQEVVDRPGWAAGNAMVILYSTRKSQGQFRWFWSSGPKLEISYEEKRFIRGYIKKSVGIGIENVLVDVNNGGWSDTTDPNGYYEVTVPDGWSGVVTPDKIGYSFNPPDRPYENINTNQSGQNFVAVSNYEKTTVTYPVSASSDDTYAITTYWSLTANHSLVFGYNGSYPPPFLIAGMRFRNIGIPNNNVVSEARLKLKSGNYQRSPVHAVIQAEDADNPGNFYSLELGQRTMTVAAVNWDITTDWSQNGWYTSPDISSVVQAVINRPGWHEGNALVITCSNREPVGAWRSVWAYDYSASSAPRMEVTYGEPPIGDFDWDWDVDLLDFTVLASQWKQQLSDPSADIAPGLGDGIVDLRDLRLFCEYYLWTE